MPSIVIVRPIAAGSALNASVQNAWLTMAVLSPVAASRSKNVPRCSGLPSVGRNWGSISAVTGENDRSPLRTGSCVYAKPPIEAKDAARGRHSERSDSGTTDARRVVEGDLYKPVMATRRDGSWYGRG